jgi:hypothetical protein
MEPQLPDDVLYRPKMGFSVPLARWFRGPLKQRVRDAVLGERLADDRLVQSRTCSTWSRPTRAARATTARRCGPC